MFHCASIHVEPFELVTILYVFIVGIVLVVLTRTSSILLSLIQDMRLAVYNTELLL